MATKKRRHPRRCLSFEDIHKARALMRTVENTRISKKKRNAAKAKVRRTLGKQSVCAASFRAKKYTH